MTKPTITQDAIDAATQLFLNGQERAINECESLIHKELAKHDIHISSANDGFHASDEDIENIRQLLAAAAPHIIEANTPVSAWQPIETCPFDQNVIFSGGAYRHSIEDIHGEVIDRSELLFIRGIHLGVKYLNEYTGTIFVLNSFGGQVLDEKNPPTHWQHLPQPPKEA